MSQNKKMFGVLRKWDAVRGFGFIVVINADKSTTSWFLHTSKIQSGTPQIGAGAQFNPGVYEKGTATPAIDVEIGEVIPKFQPPVEAGTGGVK
jgi:cold shock CspA family protein